MSRSFIDYTALVEDALRGVVRDALRRTAETGLPGSHHFFITFRTDLPGVEIPDYLRARFPDEMTIVLQHQFWGLEAGDDHFAVTLSFNKVNERLSVPYAAITSFADPSVQFGLQFRPGGAATKARPAKVPAVSGVTLAPPESPSGKEPEPNPPKTGQIVTLDAFRKK